MQIALPVCDPFSNATAPALLSNPCQSRGRGGDETPRLQGPELAKGTSKSPAVLPTKSPPAKLISISPRIFIVGAEGLPVKIVTEAMPPKKHETQFAGGGSSSAATRTAPPLLPCGKI